MPSFLIILESYTIGSKVILGIFFTVLVIIFFYYAFKMLEMVYVMRNKKPFFVHFYIRLRNLTPKQQSILKQQFSFYNKLSKKQQLYFEHRVASFINDKTFIGREGLVISDEVKILISATAVMLTFGFRDFYIGLIDKIFVYPKAFYSKANQEYHKGEFNPKLKALVLSWKDFKEGYNIGDDNLNLGIHEFTHAIHLNSIKEKDVSSTIFRDSFNELISLLTNNKLIKDELITSKYFRSYAFTNQYEFVAVLIEYFIETPLEFKNRFPEIYAKVKQMLNFHFAGY
jgi:MtfA peptidase